MDTATRNSDDRTHTLAGIYYANFSVYSPPIHVSTMDNVQI